MSSNNKNTQRTPVEIPKETHVEPSEPMLTLDDYVAQDKIQRNIAAGMRVLYGGNKQTYTAWKDIYATFLNRKV